MVAKSCGIIYTVTLSQLHGIVALDSMHVMSRTYVEKVMRRLTPSMLSRKGHLHSTLDPWVMAKRYSRQGSEEALLKNSSGLERQFLSQLLFDQSFCWANLILFYLLLWVPSLFTSFHGQYPGCSLVRVPGSCHNASLHNVGAVLPNLPIFQQQVKECP